MHLFFWCLEARAEILTNILLLFGRFSDIKMPFQINWPLPKITKKLYKKRYQNTWRLFTFPLDVRRAMSFNLVMYSAHSALSFTNMPMPQQIEKKREEKKRFHCPLNFAIYVRFHKIISIAFKSEWNVSIKKWTNTRSHTKRSVWRQ